MLNQKSVQELTVEEMLGKGVHFVVKHPNESDNDCLDMIIAEMKNTSNHHMTIVEQ